MGKNTLYITFDGLSDPLGQSQILPYLCGLAAKGYHIHILSCEKNERLEKEKEGILKKISALPITWQFILYREEGNAYSRYLYVQRLKQLATTIISEQKIGLIHCRSYIAALIGLKFKIENNIPFIFDMRGLWADERVDGKIWSKKNPIQYLFYRYFKSKEKQFLKDADAVISLTHAGLKELSRLYPEIPLQQKTQIIPCCTNTDLFNPEQRQSQLRYQAQPNEHLIIYTGSIGTWYYTREMIDCMLVWKKKIPELKLLILTRDTEALTEILKNYSKEQSELIHYEQASYAEVPAYLALAKAAIFFIKPAYSKIASSPTKMAECWSMNLPIITNSGIGDNDLYFKDNTGGILLSEFSEKEYLQSCEKYLALLKKHKHYRTIALEHFDLKMALERYNSVYEALTVPN